MKEIIVYTCEICNTQSLNKSDIENCKHRPIVCKCGNPKERWSNYCSDCADTYMWEKEKESFEKATKYTLTEYFKQFPEEILCLNDDNWFHDETELFEYIFDTYDDHDFPKYCFGTTQQIAKLELDRALEDMLCETYDEAEISSEGMKELDDFLKNWNDKYSLTYYNMDEHKVVLLSEEDYNNYRQQHFTK